MKLPTLPHTFRHGVHPHEHKETAAIASRRLPFVERYVLPLGQHTGAPSKPAVKVGERVLRGQLVAEANGYVSTCLHSPATGRVSAIASHRHPAGHLTPSIEIEADPYATQRPFPRPPVDTESLSLDQFVSLVQKGGLVGLGGAAFPAHVKYKLPEGKKCRQLVVNGCECEPYLTADHRLMLERAEAIVRGIAILAPKLGAEGSTIGVEANKLDAVEALCAAIKPGQKIEVLPLKVKYPQGAEKMLIKALFGVEVPGGKLPLDVGMVVNNVGTMAAIADWFDAGLPLIERLVTVAGPGIAHPANLLVPIGTPVRDVLRHCGISPETRLVVMGGPMMGLPLASLDVPVIKGTSGLLAMTAAEIEQPQEYNCVRCGRCLEACGNWLNPSRLARLARAGRLDQVEANYVMDCMECGACSFACPSGIPIVQLIRTAKAAIRSSKKAAS
ncbi:MAG: electron transport complex subunit RsxC [Planctomycetota bacterium]